MNFSPLPVPLARLQKQQFTLPKPVPRAILPALISIFLFLGLVLVLSTPTAAQGPGDPAPKGPEPTPDAPAPTPEPTAPTPPFQLDPALLPKIEPQLLKQLLASKGEPAPFIVYLKAQTDVAAVASTATGLNAQTKPDPLARRRAIVNALKQTARDTQAGVLQLLSGPPTGGGLSGQNTAGTEVKPLWIVNAVAARGPLATILALAARPDVEVIRLDKEIRISDPASPVQPEEQRNDRLRVETGRLSPTARLQTPAWGISKIRADLVHNALGITGTDIVVANIDTGVDWFHPALQTNYRGYMGPGKLPQHPGNWFDATGEATLYPTDGNGHGTHTMGTIAGHGGIGVAPGAQWIAARAFNRTGSAQISWLHDAFQWLLAPNGDPSLAPHIVNNSWGNNNGFDTEFEADVQALLNAGIYPIFSAGNNGPGAGTIGSPGSLDIAFAVGATTSDDELANFSSRGPSPWGKIKPEVSAPGKNVRSALPGGAYGSFDGTSMAAPHASGLAALLMQASPTLTGNLGDVSTAMMSTAVQLGHPMPNNNSGWGRIDAFNAVMSVAPAGRLQGIVTDITTGAAISAPRIQIRPSFGGPGINTSGDARGVYTQGLATGAYDVTASAFGYQAQTISRIEIATNTTTIQNFSLAPYPTGMLAGTVSDRNTGAPLTATITINGTPAGTETNPADGSYSLTLPLGAYTVTVVAAKHRITTATNINIAPGITTTQDFRLESAPTILLVDSGKWYQESQIGYYQQALDDSRYPYDLRQIATPFDNPNDIPSAAALSAYDIVIWSAPLDSPGYIGADDEIAAFLSGGGKLLLSGQDVAYFDGYWLSTASYLKNQLYVKYVQDNAGTRSITGVAGEPFAGLLLSIAGGDGANNQIFPDVVANANVDFARPLLAYSDDNLAGLHIDLCRPYRAIFLAFGFEAINSRADRSQVMQQTIDWLLQAPEHAGVELTPRQETLIGDFDTTVAHTIRLRNTGVKTDAYTMTLSNVGPYNWPASAVPSPISLAACQAQEITVTVQVPATKTWHISDTFMLAARSGNDPALSDIAGRSTKTPAPVLLVDDDRWYSFAAEMEAGLAANNIPYDYWFVPKSWRGSVPPSPPLETLQMYPMTVWYTAYDWFQPLTPTEEERLIDYLEGGGRLLFSSQDFLYNHLLQRGGSYETFARDYLGIQAHTEDYSSTLTIGQAGNPVGAHLGPYALTFPAGYRNWTDALTPTATAQIATRGQENQPNGLINAGTGPDDRQWRTAFLAYGPELLADNDRARLMQRAVGWLSWLGSSTIESRRTEIADGALITTVATISNDGPAPISTAYFTATFPSQLVPVSAGGEANLVAGQVRWHGPLAPKQSKTFTYTSQVAGPIPAGSVISQTSWLAYPEHNIRFDRVTDIPVAPRLDTSSMTVTPDQEIENNDVLTYTIILKNSGTIADPLITTTNTLPQILTLIGVDSPSSGLVTSHGQGLIWTTPLSPDEVATLTFRTLVSSDRRGTFENVAYVQGTYAVSAPLSAPATFKPLRYNLPIIFKN